jgi:hypothetical protein
LQYLMVFYFIRPPLSTNLRQIFHVSLPPQAHATQWLPKETNIIPIHAKVIFLDIWILESTSKKFLATNV